MDGKVRFEPLGQDDTERSVGRLHIPMNAKFVINDGQHRRAAIEVALRDNPDLGDETISVVFFLDFGLKRCQQMFSDLNRFSVRPTTSLSLLYDHRDELSHVAKTLMQRVPVFDGLTETERSTISNRSIKLFTLSGIYSATQTLLSDVQLATSDDKISVAAEFWTEVSQQISDWQLAKQRKVTAADLRRDYVHAHTLALVALARVGNSMLHASTKNWKFKLAKLRTVDWARSNFQIWEGRAMSAGRLSKRNVNITLTANYLKQHVGLKLTPEEQDLENELKRNKHGS